MYTLICVTFSLPSGVRGWLRLLLVALPGLFCLPFCTQHCASFLSVTKLAVYLSGASVSKLNPLVPWLPIKIVKGNIEVTSLHSCRTLLDCCLLWVQGSSRNGGGTRRSATWRSGTRSWWFAGSPHGLFVCGVGACYQLLRPHTLKQKLSITLPTGIYLITSVLCSFINILTC